MKLTNEELAAHIQSVFTPVHMTSRAEIIEYYRDTYKGEKVNKRGDIIYEWKTKIVTDLQGIATNKAGEPMSRASIARRFQSGRENAAVTPKTKAEFETLGKRLPPTGLKAPKNGVKITLKGKVKLSRGGRKDKKGKKRGDGYAKFQHTWELKGIEVLQPTMNNLFTDYFSNFEKNPVVNYDLDSEPVVEAIE